MNDQSPTASADASAPAPRPMEETPGLAPGIGSRRALLRAVSGAAVGAFALLALAGCGGDDDDDEDDDDD